MLYREPRFVVKHRTKNWLTLRSGLSKLVNLSEKIFVAIWRRTEVRVADEEPTWKQEWTLICLMVIKKYK